MNPQQPANISALSAYTPSYQPAASSSANVGGSMPVTIPDASSGVGPKPVRAQIRANATQAASLAAAFDVSEIADASVLERLESETGLPRKWIANWYARQRAKKRAAAAKQAAVTVPVASGSAPAGDVAAGPSNTAGLEVKKEAYEAAINTNGLSVSSGPGRKKRQAKAQSNGKGVKKRKIVADPQETRIQVQDEAHVTAAASASASVTMTVPPTIAGSAAIVTGPANSAPLATASGSRTNPGAGLVRSASSLLFEKMSHVKLERYTPPPEVLLSSNKAAPSASANGRSAQVHVPMTAQQTHTQLEVRSGSRVAQAMNNPALVSSGRRRGRPKKNTDPGLAVPNTAVPRNQAANPDSHRMVAALPKRLGSPSDVAMKSRRQREHYVGEGPIMRTQWQNHTADSFQDGLTASSSSSSTVWNHAVTTNATHFDYNAAQFYAPVSPVVQAPAPNVSVAYQTRVKASYAAPAGMYGPGITTASGSSAPLPAPQAFRVDLAASQAPAHHFQDPGQSNTLRVDEQTGMVFPQIYAAPEDYCAETEWLLGFQEHLERTPDVWMPSVLHPDDSSQEYSPDTLDPLHAPLKHLTDIVTPFCDSLGITYDKLADLDRERKQVVMDRLLDEDMGMEDPFKAAMGLVMATKLGLRWEEE